MTALAVIPIKTFVICLAIRPYNFPCQHLFRANQTAAETAAIKLTVGTNARLVYARCTSTILVFGLGGGRTRDRTLDLSRVIVTACPISPPSRRMVPRAT